MNTKLKNIYFVLFASSAAVVLNYCKSIGRTDIALHECSLKKHFSIGTT